MEPMPGGNENVATLILFEDTDCENQSYGPSETSMLDTQSTESCDPSTSGCSSSQSTPATVAERCSNPRSMETSNYEATLDPATRLALIRKRKQRTTAAARLDNTLSGFVEWVRESDQRKEANMKERDKEDIFFQKEIINNLRVASTCLQRLTQYLTESPSEFNVGKAEKKNMWKTGHASLVRLATGISCHVSWLTKVTQRQISVTQQILGTAVRKTVRMRVQYPYLVAAVDKRGHFPMVLGVSVLKLLKGVQRKQLSFLLESKVIAWKARDWAKTTMKVLLT